MFRGNKSESDVAELSNKKNHIEQGTKIRGDIESHGNIRFDGEMVGNVKSKSKVVMGESAKMEGTLVANTAEISGEISGTLNVEELLILKSTAVVRADVTYGKNQIEPGAVLDGKVKQGGGIVKNLNEKEVSKKAEKSA